MKKKTIRRSLSLLCAFALLFSLSISAAAAGSPPSTYKDDIAAQEAVNKGYDTPEHTSQGPAYAFNSVDMTGNGGTGISPNAYNRYGYTIIYDNYVSAYYPVEFHERAFLTKSSIETQSFVRYISKSWAHASSYTYTQNEAINWTVKGSATAEIYEKIRVALDLSYSRTAGIALGTTIPADKSKNSKLGLASDFAVT